MRRALTLTALAAALAGPARATAQQCHPINASAWRNQGLALGVRLDAAGYRNRRFEGDFEGLALALSFNHPRVSVGAMLPGYRIVRNGATAYGVGDLLLSLRTPIRRWATARTSVGLGVAATLPTGRASEGLGMGHVMIMPEFWWLREMGRVQLLGSIGFGRALAGKEASQHHASGPAPIVNPMNLAEIEASLGGYVQLNRLLWLKMTAFGAMPVGNAGSAGATRIILSQGIALNVRGLEFSAELQAPLAGSPFLARGVLQAAYRFDLARSRRRR